VKHSVITVDMIMATLSCPWNSSTEPTFTLSIPSRSISSRIFSTCQTTTLHRHSLTWEIIYTYDNKSTWLTIPENIQSQHPGTTAAFAKPESQSWDYKNSFTNTFSLL